MISILTISCTCVLCVLLLLLLPIGTSLKCFKLITFRIKIGLVDNLKSFILLSSGRLPLLIWVDHSVGSA